MNKIILTDADGVLVTWVTGFEKFMESKGYSVIPDTEQHYFMDRRYSITDEESRVLIREYNESAFIADLPPNKDAVEYVKKLAAHGFKFICITSISSHPDALKYRTQNLTNLFGDVFQEIFCLEMSSPKKASLMPWEGSGLFWIEDHIKNAEAGHELGLKSVLVYQDHNAHYRTDKFNVVGPENPWQEIYHLVCKEYNI